MSAYVVSKETIDVIVKGLIDYDINIQGVKYDDIATIFVNLRYEPLGQCLVDQNYASVNCRYRENLEPYKYKYNEPKKYNDGILLGCIKCYNYQACETPDYEESNIYCALMYLQTLMLEKLISQKGLDIPWGID